MLRLLGCLSAAPVACELRVCKIELSLYGVGNASSSSEEGKELAESGLCSKADVDKIGCGNAETLLGVKIPREHLARTNDCYMSQK